ncbi:TonB-system energizer ExbB [Helicobacter fennelliae]|uniref:Ferric siderophore transport system, biopolymer transport protein ExbB n=2 Tax=Helicobacter fennelliae TaxID=215 RepID=T1DW54_9HELI|nr:TonB-system energizer ExbB [Helicobacter fennelliae]GAD19313.1 ferric siderophore transport system, biopolymer transport protein ExbB [Helicobacter fennelliae MRY12-0050]SQB99087.1 biopolymer transport protein [Helicobacter fennelliae]STP08364.1 biopolymer transport protein [Helicobacter fennelliae]STQ84777.1 biopolymer transport protein [Helicobacter fennelliae]
MEFLRVHIDLIIFCVLGFMSFLAVWFSIERFIYFVKINIDVFQNIDDLEESLTKNLTILYVIYSNAPYVGLLGTVVGIMITFYDMGMSGGMDAKTIMVGLSLALKATAFGLLVAIPTLVVYNFLLRRIDVILNRYKHTHLATTQATQTIKDTH